MERKEGVEVMEVMEVMEVIHFKRILKSGVNQI
jgi:hypothetical protein